MRLVSFSIEGRATWGTLEGDRVNDRGTGEIATLRAALAASAQLAGGLIEWVHASAEHSSYALSQVELAPVIPDPGKILCVGLNYEMHRQETGRAETRHPTLFTRFADSQVAHGAPLIRPRVSAMLDYEGELALVIGKPGRAIEQSRALDHVAGYACYNDATIRDWQRHTHQFTPGKNFPGTGAFGPSLVTPDEAGELGRAQLETRLNGEVMQHACIGEMIFPIAQLISYCSAFTNLAPGDVIVTGTPGGVGDKRKPPIYLRSGDTVEVEVTGVGLLRNHVSDESL